LQSISRQLRILVSAEAVTQITKDCDFGPRQI